MYIYPFGSGSVPVCEQGSVYRSHIVSVKILDLRPDGKVTVYRVRSYTDTERDNRSWEGVSPSLRDQSQTRHPVGTLVEVRQSGPNQESQRLTSYSFPSRVHGTRSSESDLLDTNKTVVGTRETDTDERDPEG